MTSRDPRVRTRPLALVAAVSALSLLAAGCGGDGAASSDDELVIGTTMPLSGPQEALSNSYHSMDAYFEELNAAGGIDGVKVKLVAKDDQFNPVNTPAAMRALVDQDQVQMLCANQGSGTFAAVSDYLTGKGVGAVPMTGESALLSADATGFGLLTPYELTGATLVRHAVEELGHTKIAIAYTEDGVGLPFKSGAEQQLEAAGLEPVAEVQLNATATDQTAAAAKLKESGAEMVLFNHVAPVVSQVVRATRRVGFTPMWGLSYPALNEQVVDLSDGALVDHAVFTTPFPSHDDPVLADYRAAMEEHHPDVDETDFLTVEGWVVGSVCADVIRRAVEAAGGVPDREQLLDALADTTIDSELVRGLSWTQESRDGSRQLRIVAATADGFTEVAPYAEAPEVTLGEEH
ncbi:ABC transporter substrate-binding protein [Nocardioides pantholopis]|uniref:ABC transporter substrate-binding protein n=1 Tax=Nocardioides pantholopis TaxID=2483798 RepID=UPI000FDC646F|nr:ABC transporter substrate-binding protein [Nocardioides pantholopis]